MSDSVRSERWLLESIPTRAFVGDEDGVQLLIADFDSWSVSAYQDPKLDAIWFYEGTIDEVLSDTLSPWDQDAVGYNFEHTMDYGVDGFEPTAGTVTLEYVLKRKNAGPIVLVHVALLRSMRTRVIA